MRIFYQLENTYFECTCFCYTILVGIRVFHIIKLKSLNTDFGINVLVRGLEFSMIRTECKNSYKEDPRFCWYCKHIRAK